jgi:hypothetical protein
MESCNIFTVNRTINFSILYLFECYLSEWDVWIKNDDRWIILWVAFVWCSFHLCVQSVPKKKYEVDTHFVWFVGFLQTNSLNDASFNFVQFLQEMASEQKFEVIYADIAERSNTVFCMPDDIPTLSVIWCTEHHIANVHLAIRSESVFANQNGPTLHMTLTLSTCKDHQVTCMFILL